jgi:RHS repeat-associated protein
VKYQYTVAHGGKSLGRYRHWHPREFDGTLIRRSGRTRYEHDAQGRLIRKTVALLNGQRREWTFTWNAEDRLTLATNPDGETWAYAYDALGRRTAKWRLDESGSVVDRTAFAWDGTRLAEEVTANGTGTTWDYVPGGHRVVAQTTHHTGTATVVDRLTSPAGATRFHAVITDVVGTPTELIAPDGTTSWASCRTLWGTDLPAASDGSINCPLRFPGQYADLETGLQYNHFRFYDPETTRYLSPDPLGLGPADNHHGYTHNPSIRRD